MFKKLIVTIYFSILLSSCTVTKIPLATGGSKSDGFIELSYTVGSFEQPVIDFDSALKNAIKRCNAWNYESAESFGGSKSECSDRGPYGNCVSTRFYINYQCINKDSKSDK